jgi:hypothetical protein
MVVNVAKVEKWRKLMNEFISHNALIKWFL